MRRPTVLNKRDANEPEILKVIGKLGVTWHEAGPLDGWIHVGTWVPIEIKMPGEPLTRGQEQFVEQCIALHRPFFIWRRVQDAISTIEYLRASYGTTADYLRNRGKGYG